MSLHSRKHKGHNRNDAKRSSAEQVFDHFAKEQDSQWDGLDYDNDYRYEYIPTPKEFALIRLITMLYKFKIPGAQTALSQLW